MATEEPTPAKAIYAALGRRIRSGRVNASLTQTELAEQIGLSRTSVTNIEKGEQQFMVHTLIAISIAINLSPCDLLSDVSPSVEVPTKDPPSLEELLAAELPPDAREWMLQATKTR